MYRLYLINLLYFFVFVIIIVYFAITVKDAITAAVELFSNLENSEIIPYVS